MDIEQLEVTISDLSYIQSNLEGLNKSTVESAIESLIILINDLKRIDPEEYENLVHENKMMALKLNELGLSDEDISSLM